ncbi:hypothetical protein M426DRAFT_17010 [Hypoxylon sp. CI-4A]|nr:hypothetical protein M426DRAFT_17010 [Hypoxylon sp. CI-4A]
MPSSNRTVRIRGIPNDVSSRNLASSLAAISAPRSKARAGLSFVRTHPSSASPLIIHPPVFSLAPQLGTQTATVTLESSAIKNAALDIHNDWDLDDNFIGITMLHSDPEPVLDIVSIHGLNGNAFDTFAWNDRHMWLRDYLPLNPLLNKTRTMTFGYGSSSKDSGNNESVREWASALLREVSSVRESPAERSRPIIFVCHSLGGLVVREAMVGLQRNSQLYEGLDLKHCGILFLATPHSGSRLADWNDIMVHLAQLAGIRGKAINNTLKSFNYNSKIAKEDFGLLDPIPPYECLYETRKLMTGIKRRIIVEADSAGLNAVSAQPMAGVDHRQICRFKSDKDPGYKQVVDCLRRIQSQIVKANHAQEHDRVTQVPTQPQRDNISEPDLLPRQESVSSTPNACQVSASPQIGGGQGIGGEIQRSKNFLVIDGGHATGATMSLAQLKEFRGTVRGGTALGANIA